MGYTRTQVRTALAQAKQAGRVTSGMSPELRETELELERWGFLPLKSDADVDRRVRDWYIAQGLAAPSDGEQPRRKSTKAEPGVIMSAPPNDAALLAAEAALAAAQAALAYARAITSPAA